MVTERRVREYGLTTGELGISSGQTVVAVLLPLFLVAHAPSALWIGAVIAGEGLFALLMPYGIGLLSDRLPAGVASRFGRRNFFLLVVSPVMAAALAVLPFMDGYWSLAAVAFVFFAALHSYRTPLEALIADTSTAERLGRVQGVRGVFHAIGLGYGLVGGGLLYSVWEPAPFLVAALLVLATTALTYTATPETGSRSRRPDRGAAGQARDAGDAGTRDGSATGPAAERAVWRELKDRPEMRWLLAANALWTGGVDGIRPYLFLFATVVLGIQIAETSLLLLVLLGGVGIGALAAGTLGDRFGRARVLLGAALVAGSAMVCGVLVRDVPLAIVVLVPAGLGAAAFISLPYPLFVETAGDFARGRHAGLFNVSLGVGRLLSPLAVGLAIDQGRALFPELEGYPAMWPVAGGLVLLGALALLRASSASRRRLP
jgi:maltose/moltooligosaccharide transporter